MKDINGNEFKVGCVFESNCYIPLEVLKVLEDKLIVLGVGPFELSSDSLKISKSRILHYRELTPDKNGKMLCKGDVVSGEYYKNVSVYGMAGRYLIIEYEPGEFTWSLPDLTTFVSRPTDEPNAKSKLQAQIAEVGKKIEELKQEHSELKKQAEEM